MADYSTLNIAKKTKYRTMTNHAKSETILLPSWVANFLQTGLVLLFFVALAYAITKDGLPAAGSDPRGTSVVAQNIIEHHDIFILHGKCASFFKSDGEYGYQVQNKDGKIYYYFPIGTPILITPLVYIGNVFGAKAYNGDNDAKFQKSAVMGISFAILLTTYLIAVRFFSTVWSMSLSALSFFGSLTGPTVGTGLWSIDFAVLFTSITILLLLKISVGDYRKSSYIGLSLGTIFFFGFLVRPTFAVVILLSFIFLLYKNRRILVYSAALSGSLLALFIAYCYFNIGHILPPYYLLSRLSTINSFAAFYGLLFSPSRSIFIFTPALLLLPFAYSGAQHTKYKPLIGTLAVIIVLLFTTNLFFPHWDAGFSYGPRILTGMSYIGVIALLILAGYLAKFEGNYRLAKFLAALLFLGCLIDVNGMYNKYTLEWNSYPSSDKYTNFVVWSKSYPQFLMNKEMLIDKCYTQTRYLGVSDAICSNIGAPQPGSKFFERYSRSILHQFNALAAARSCYANKNHLSLTPYNAEKEGCLSTKYGGFKSPSPNDNWTKTGGWLGSWAGNKFAIGVVGSYSVLKNIIAAYGQDASEIYFPAPSKFVGEKINGSETGNLLMVFNNSEKLEIHKFGRR